MSNEFACIDFETANASRGSVCACAIVKANRHEILDHYYTLVKPKDLWFDPINVSIHGITEDDVEDAPEFDEIWPRIEALRGGLPLVAHNASFDISVLRHVLSDYAITWPDLGYCCTYLAARQTWPGMLRYSLDCVAEFLGIEFEHHKALEDARTCAVVMQRILDHHGIDSLDELPSKILLNNGHLFCDGWRPCKKHHSYAHAQEDLRNIQPQTSEFDDGHPFFLKTFVFTGELETLSRHNAAQLVVNKGGQCQNGVRKDTNYLVCGRQDLRQLRGNDKSSKFRKAEEYAKQGLDIELLAEDEFLEMFGDQVPDELRRQPVCKKDRPVKQKAGAFGISLSVDLDTMEVEVAYSSPRGSTDNAVNEKSIPLPAPRYDHVALDNVAVWSKQKTREIAALCTELKPIINKRLKVTRRYEAPSRNVPHPHTYGELALAQARLVAGDWRPEEKVSIEILHGGELLGRALLHRDTCIGFDVADLPQAKGPRPSYKDRFNDSEAEDEVWERYFDKLPPLKDAIGRIVDVPDPDGDGDWQTFELYPHVMKQRQQAILQAAEELFSSLTVAA